MPAELATRSAPRAVTDPVRLPVTSILAALIMLAGSACGGAEPEPLSAPTPTSTVVDIGQKQTAVLRVGLDAADTAG